MEFLASRAGLEPATCCVYRHNLCPCATITIKFTAAEICQFLDFHYVFYFFKQ